MLPNRPIWLVLQNGDGVDRTVISAQTGELPIVLLTDLRRISLPMQVATTAIPTAFKQDVPILLIDCGGQRPI